MKATQNQLKETIFPKGDLASADYFTGKVWARNSARSKTLA